MSCYAFGQISIELKTLKSQNCDINKLFMGGAFIVIIVLNCHGISLFEYDKGGFKIGLKNFTIIM